MFTTIIFIAVISVLVFVHEFGHFVFAKRAGMKVEEFGFGFPPRLWGFKRGETIYSINWIPFGGFVKILGEDGEERDNPRSFGSKPFWPRMKVVIAGVTMNFLFAILLLMIGNFIGLRKVVENSALSLASDLQVQIYQISPDSPAQAADLRILDEIKAFRLSNGGTVAITDSKDVSNFVNQHKGEKVTIILQRGGEELQKEVGLRANPPAGQGPLGIAPILTGIYSYPWYESVWRGVYDSVGLVINTVYGYGLLFKTLLFHGKLLADVSGPIGIANLTGQAARVGFNFLLQFMAMISVNLAVLNIIPFPALDGGRAFLLIVEKIRGVTLNKKVEGVINASGFILLLALMAFITIKDIGKFF
ncbi:MAG: M50 family metallopeptidase [Patescibacteria group bacterium]